MASVDTSTNNPNDPNNPNNVPGNINQPGAGQTNQPATTGGAGGVTSTGAGNVTGQVVGTANPSQPFQNISSYLAANEPQSKDLANQVASTVSQPIAQAQSDVTNASDAFTKSVNAGYTPQNADISKAVATNPTAAAATPEDIAAFQAQLNDIYSGPTDFTQTPNYSKIQSAITSAQTNANNALTPTGIQTLLKGIEGSQATAGINNLDTLLLAQNPENFKTIADAGNVANTTNNALQNFLLSQTTANNTAAQKAVAEAQAASSGATGALNTAANNIVDPVKAAFNSDLTGTENYNQTLNSIINAISSGNIQNLSPDQQKAIGLNPDILTALSQYPQIFPAVSTNNMPNPSIYYSGPNTAMLPTAPSQVETPEQAAAIAALQALNGGNSLDALSGLTPTAPATPFKVPTDLGAYNNVGLADFLYNALEPTYLQYLQIPGGTSTLGNNPQQIQDYMALLAKLTNQSLPQPTPVQPPGGGGPPFLGPPGGDVHITR